MKVVAKRWKQNQNYIYENVTEDYFQHMIIPIRTQMCTGTSFSHHVSRAFYS